MDKTTLVERDFRDGARFIEELDAAGFPVHAAFWLDLDESEMWRLYLVSPLVAEEGPRAAYVRVDGILETLAPAVDFRLDDVSVIAPTDHLAQLFRQFKTTPPAPHLEGKRYHRITVNNRHVGNAYIYRMQAEELPPGKILMSQPRRR